MNLCNSSKLLIFLNILNFLDMIVTIIGINKFGIIAEANPNIVYIVSNFGFIPLIIIKIVGVYLVSFFYKKNIDFIVKKAITDKQKKYTCFWVNFSNFIILLMCFIFIIIIEQWVVVIV